MKLFEIAAQKSRVNAMNVVDLAATLKRECSKSLNQFVENKLYRGADYNFRKGLGFGESFQGELRKSANTDNFYTVWVDNSKEWKDFPKRSKSFIGASSAYISDGYGDVALMIPFDNAQVAICPEDDFWNSFDLPGHRALDNLNSFCRHAYKLVFKKDIDKDPTYEELRKVFSQVKYADILEAALEIDKQLNDYNDHKVGARNPPADEKYATYGVLQYEEGKFTRRLNSLIKQGETLADMMDRLLKPNNFKVTDGANFTAPEDREVFIEGKCIFIIPENLSRADLTILKDELRDYPEFLSIIKNE